MARAPSQLDRPAVRGRFDDRFNASDAVLWTIERDPSLRTTIVAVALLDRTPDWQRLRQRLIEASVMAPRFRQRVVEMPLRLGPPRWEIDDRFDIDYHLRRIRAPEPGGLDTVLRLAEPMAMGVFDKDRPLWEFTLVEGLADGRAALIEKIHHSVTDGVGGILLASLVVDDTRRGRRSSAAPAEQTPAASARPSGPGRVIESVAHAAADNAHAALTLAGQAARVVFRLSAAAASTRSASSPTRPVAPARSAGCWARRPSRGHR